MPIRLLTTSWLPFALQAVEPLKRRWRLLARHPFPTLVRHFSARLLRGDSPTQQFEVGGTGLLGLLATPGAFICFSLLDKYSYASVKRFFTGEPAVDPFLAALPDRYFLIVFSMTVIGLVTVFKWDRILPDHEDYTNLAPLPLSPTSLFLANLVAIVGIAVIFALDVNAASGVLFPLVVTAELGSAAVFLRFAAVHATGVLLASAFMFFACFSIMGILMTALPRRAFRVVSLWVRGFLVAGLLALLLTSFAEPSLVRRLETEPDSWLRLLPPLWYTGLYLPVDGPTGVELARMGRTGVHSAIGAFVLAMAAYALGYRRSFLRTIEAGEGRLVVQRRARWSRILALLPVGGGFERASYLFAMRVLLRSEAHCLSLGGFLGLGLVLACQAAASAPVSPDSLPSAKLLSIPLIGAYFLISGLRLPFELPASLNANWTFRIIPSPAENEPLAAARKIMLTFLAPIVLLPCLAAYSAFYGVGVGVVHTAYVLGLSLCLTEILLANYRKIPFTCTLPPFRNDVILWGFLSLVGFGVFTGLAAGIERWMFREPYRFLGLPVAMFLAWRWRATAAEDDDGAEPGIVFDDVPLPVVQRLNLLDRS